MAVFLYCCPHCSFVQPLKNVADIYILSSFSVNDKYKVVVSVDI